MDSVNSAPVRWSFSQRLLDPRLPDGWLPAPFFMRLSQWRMEPSAAPNRAEYWVFPPSGSPGDAPRSLRRMMPACHWLPSGALPSGPGLLEVMEARRATSVQSPVMEMVLPETWAATGYWWCSSSVRVQGLRSGPVVLKVTGMLSILRFLP